MARGSPRVADSETGDSEQNRRSKRGRYFSLLTPGLWMLPEPWPGRDRFWLSAGTQGWCEIRQKALGYKKCGF